jgi:pantetheine-phosphate adenylyltransferase
MVRGLYPGSFDPITKGHMNIIKQACDLFDEVIVAVMQNPNKNSGFFTLEERYKLIQELCKNINNIKVIIGEGAAVDVALLTECKVIIRGLRCLSDYDDEIQLHQTNKELSDGKINTVCFFADTEYQFVSSTKVRNVFALNKDISKYVEPEVQKKMIKKRGDFYV